MISLLRDIQISHIIQLGLNRGYIRPTGGVLR